MAPQNNALSAGPSGSTLTLSYMRNLSLAPSTSAAASGSTAPSTTVAAPPPVTVGVSATVLALRDEVRRLAQEIELKATSLSNAKLAALKRQLAQANAQLARETAL